MNFIPALNLGISESLKRTKMSMLSRSEVTNDNGDVIGYRATVLVTADNNKYVKRDGEVVEGPNSLQTFTVQVNSNNMPKGKGMISNIELINPRIVSNYATSQPGSTFAQIHATIMCDEIRFSENLRQHSTVRKEGEK